MYEVRDLLEEVFERPEVRPFLIERVMDVARSEPLARSLTLVHRRPEFKAAPAAVNKMQELVAEGKINFLTGQVSKLEGDDGQLSMVHLAMASGETTIHATRMLPFFGLTMKLGPVADWGLELNDNLIKVDTEKFESSVPGVFAIGDRAVNAA